MENALGFIFALSLITFLLTGAIALLGENAYNRRVLGLTHDQHARIKKIANVTGLILLVVSVVTFVYVNL